MPKSRTFRTFPSRTSTSLNSRHVRPASSRAVKRARVLIELMLREMQRGLRDPAHRTSEEWNKLFGAKQSMVVNLQKLVASLAALPQESECAETLPDAISPDTPITPEEMELLKAWLAEGRNDSN